MEKERKEIGIEKLVELLNEYEPRIAGNGEHYDNIWWYRHFMSDKTVANNATRYIVSKEYGFIKWLVENDKIDLDKVEEKSDLIEYLIGTPTKVYENIIMILAIQDEPIRFLCEIIK